jgi:hypothetical protein
VREKIFRKWIQMIQAKLDTTGDTNTLSLPIVMTVQSLNSERIVCWIKASVSKST